MGRATIIWRMLVRFWAVVGLVTTFIGFGGLPDDLATWARWVDRVVNDPLVLDLANWAVRFAEFVNLWPVRVALVIAGILMIIWPLRWFWRLRHRITFRWRRALAERVWIGREAAITVIKESRWGRIKEPHTIGRIDLLGAIRNLSTIHGLSEDQKKHVLFAEYIEKTLEQFCASNPEACRVNEGESEVDEVALRKFLSVALDREIKDEFGAVPDFRVS